MWLWEINNLQVVEATNMDYVSEKEIENKINKAIEDGFKIIEKF